MDVYIIGAPFTGKSTLLERLTGGKGVGSLKLNDERFEALVDFFKPKKITPPYINLHDNPKNLAKADALLEVVGGLTENFISFVDTTLNFLSFEAEVLLSNIKKLEKRGEEKTLRILKKAYNAVSEGIPLFSLGLDEEEVKVLRGYGLPSLKPRLIILNKTRESNIGEEVYYELRAQNLPYLEMNILEDKPEEMGRKIFLKILEITGRIVFFTPSEKEVRGWLLEKGSTVVEAAGKIHNDLARTFVKAEVIDWESLIKGGGWKGAKEKNLIRLEGKDYIVKDGDCIYIRASAIKS
jgi:ribosome-binding ATPase YchF (GTP1/OBG family)